MPWNGNKPVEMPVGGVGNLYRDYVPESEQHLYPGMGMGAQTPDYVPDGMLAHELVEETQAKRRLEEIKRARGDRRAISRRGEVEAGAAGADDPAAAAASPGVAEREPGAVEPDHGAADAPPAAVRGRPRRERPGSV